MSWEKLDLHLENLIPGLAVLGVFHFGWRAELPNWSGDSAFASIALVGIAYTIGVAVNVLARLLLDRLSEGWARRLVFIRFAWRKIEALGYDRARIKRLTSDDVHTLYNDACTLATFTSIERLGKEFDKRRQTARLLRTVLPVSAVFVTGLAFHLNWPVAGRVAGAVGGFAIVYLIVLFLYAYSEVTIFHEAYHIVKNQMGVQFSQGGPERQTESKN